MIAVQGGVLRRAVRRPGALLGLRDSRELGAAIAGFSPTIATALLAAGDGEPWLVAGMMVVSGLISLVAFLASVETKDIDIGAEESSERSVPRVSAALREEPVREPAGRL